MTCHSFNCFSIVWGQGNAPLVTSLLNSCYMTNEDPPPPPPISSTVYLKARTKGMAGNGGGGGGGGVGCLWPYSAGNRDCYKINQQQCNHVSWKKLMKLYKTKWNFLRNIHWRILNTVLSKLQELMGAQGWSHLLIGWCHWTPYWQSCLCCILSFLVLALSPLLALLLFIFQKERRDKLWNPYNQACIAETARRLDQWDAEHPSPSAVGLIFEFLSLAIVS